MEQISTYLQSVKIAKKQQYENMTVFPLLSADGVEPDYLVLDQAMEEGLVEVTEVNDTGEVPELWLVNRGKRKVLLVEGEELVGAKQNRIVNASFLVPAGAEVPLPVSCVERGRWRYNSARFGSQKRVMNASLRHMSQDAVKSSLRRSREYRSDQGRIWAGISEKASRLGVASETSAMADIFESFEDRLSDYMKAFTLVDCQVGAVVAIDGQVVGLEAFGSAETFERFFERLIRSYALDSVDGKANADAKPVAPAEAKRLVESAATSGGSVHPGLGVGETVAFESKTVSGAALVEGGRLLHLSAFRI
jgi:hypothetical protein